MKCTKCSNSDSKVVESRDIGEGNSIRRRRQCLKCNHRFTTYERVEVPALIVMKKDGTQQLFDRLKLVSGINKAIEKRPVTPAQVEKLVTDIEREVFERDQSAIAAKDLGELIMKGLMKLDDVAYVRFASVYRSFADISSFEKELAKVKKARHAKV